MSTTVDGTSSRLSKTATSVSDIEKSSMRELSSILFDAETAPIERINKINKNKHLFSLLFNHLPPYISNKLTSNILLYIIYKVSSI